MKLPLVTPLVWESMCAILYSAIKRLRLDTDMQTVTSEVVAEIT